MGFSSFFDIIESEKIYIIMNINNHMIAAIFLRQYLIVQTGSHKRGRPYFLKIFGKVTAINDF